MTSKSIQNVLLYTEIKCIQCAFTLFKPAISQTAWKFVFSVMYILVNVLSYLTRFSFVPRNDNFHVKSLQEACHTAQLFLTVVLSQLTFSKRVALRENTKERQHFISRLITICFRLFPLHASVFMVYVLLDNIQTTPRNNMSPEH